MRNTIKVNNHRLISRSDLAAIADMIPHGAKILDLGCGSGRLLKALKMLKDAKIMGVELDQGKIIECVRRGVPVIQSNLDGALPEETLRQLCPEAHKLVLEKLPKYIQRDILATEIKT